MPRATPKLPPDSIQQLCDTLDANVSEWHHVARIGQDKGFDVAPTDEQVAGVLAAIGALTDILRAGMAARAMETRQAELRALLAAKAAPG